MLKTRTAFVVSSNEKISKLLRRFPKETIAVVLEGEKYKGIVTDLTLRLARCTPDEKVGTIAWGVSPLNKKMPIEQICERFLHGYKELPIEEGKEIRIVRDVDVLSALLSEGRIPKLSAVELSKPLEKISHTASIALAAAVMRKKEASHLAVVDDGKLIGIVSSADVTRILELTKEHPPMGREKAGLDKISIKSVVTTEPECASEKITTIEAAAVMIKKGLSALLIGSNILTVADLIRSTVRPSEPPVEIIGLAEEDAILRDDIRKECAAVLTKISKFLPIKALRLTIKKHEAEGRRMKWSMRAAIPRTQISVSAFSWDPFVALHYVLREVERLATKEKEKKGVWRRTKKKRGLAAKLRLGEEVGRPIK